MAATCRACGASLGAAGAVRCPACGAAAGLLALELPPSPSATPAGPPGPPATSSAAPSPRTRRAVVADRPAAAFDARAVVVKFPRGTPMDLPDRCACCGGPAAARRSERRTESVGGYVQTYALEVPYCSRCRGHHYRPALRAVVWILALAGLIAAYAKVVGVRPDSFERAMGLLALFLVASRALSYLAVPRLPTGRTHAREGRALWVRSFDTGTVELVVCHEGYRAGLPATPHPARKPRELRRRLSGLLFGTAAELKAAPVLALLRPLGTLVVSLGLLWWVKPLPVDERAYLAFQAAPTPGGAERFAQQFGTSKRLPAVEDYLMGLARTSRDPYLMEMYLRSFPKGRFRDEIVVLRHDRDFERLEAAPSRDAAIAFLRAYPTSLRVPQARALLLAALGNSGFDERLSPPIRVLERIFAAASAGKVTVRVSGLENADYRKPLEIRLRDALRGLGLEPEWTAGPAILQVDGGDGVDKDFSYSKFSFAGGGAGPYREFAWAKVSVIRPGASRAGWTAEIRAETPSTVTYTVVQDRRFGSFDHGPSQHDVHSQTVPIFVEALKGLFDYR